VPNHQVVSREEWIEARKSLLAKEKEFTRWRDDVSRRRRELPWVKVEKNYVFDTPTGKQTLAELFEGRSQLIVYHFMFTPGWEAGCPSCSYLMDHIDGMLPHLNARDVTFVAVARAPLQELQPFKKRMGWRFNWVSSFGNDFNVDYNVTFTEEQVKTGDGTYNYTTVFPAPFVDFPGASVFFKDESGQIFHTYSTYSRGLDILVGTYNYLDLTPKGRDEDGLAFSMAWVRHHDRYSPGYVVDPKAGYIPPKQANCPHCSTEVRS
jgi:predicted dithiol-disulfide oxidoreductase (DUF899 family)